MALTWGNFKKLPMDIINVIFGKMSYKPQSQELMADIRSFYTNHEILVEMYSERFNPPGGGAGAHNWDDWLENDLWGWANGDQALMNGFHDHIYDLWMVMSRYWPDDMKAPSYDTFTMTQPPPVRRHIYKYKIDCYLTNYLEKKPSRVQVRLFLSVMTPSQRVGFVDRICKIWDEALMAMNAEHV